MAKLKFDGKFFDRAMQEHETRMHAWLAGPTAVANETSMFNMDMLRKARDILQAAETQAERDALKGAGISLVCSPLLPAQAGGTGLTSCPWWLTELEYQRHRQWCGETFGWRHDAFLFQDELCLSEEAFNLIDRYMK